MSMDLNAFYTEFFISLSLESLGEATEVEGLLIAFGKIYRCRLCSTINLSIFLFCIVSFHSSASNMVLVSSKCLCTLVAD